MAILITTYRVQAQPLIRAISVSDDEITLDGKLTEKVWNIKPAITEFTQREPFEGKPATNAVSVYIGYSTEYLYLSGFIQKEKSSIQKVVSRRDNAANSERIIFSFDTFLDKITSYSFGITASAVRLDYYHPTDNAFDRDYSWNPIWEAKTYIDSAGWTFEARIPFSQLRFDRSENIIFGLNVNHYVPNTNEDAFSVYIPRDEAGWASHFEPVHGFENIIQPTRTELMPYLASDFTHLATVDPNNPFVNTNSLAQRLGADVKWGIGSNLTMDATINPDFGQVEADPAFVNLTQFEVIQTERRPFFTEGAALFNGGGARYFYSRRIGAKPSYVPSGDFVDVAGNSTILGAVKLTGRLKSGLSIGVMNSVTGQEFAKVFSNDTRTTSRILAEPLSNYSIVRLLQEFGEYGSRVGFISTNVVRNLKTPELESLLNRSATTVGTDWMIRFDKRKYEFRGNVGMSHIVGSQAAILRNQLGSARYFQRPDSPHIRLDNSRTSLTGITSSATFAKVEGSVVWEAGFATESPELELNDMGVLQSADDFVVFSEIGYRILTPTDYYNRIGFNLGVRQDWNYGGLSTRRRISVEGEYLFPDFHRIGFYYEHQFEAFSDDITRGGPVMKRPFGNYYNLSMSTNRGATIITGITADYYENGEGSFDFGAYPRVSGMLAGRWEFSVSPRYSYNRDKRQYLTQLNRTAGEGTFGRRFVFSQVNRSTLSLQTRLNYSFTPDLSVELYAEPFVSNAIFSNYAELKEAKTNELLFYGMGSSTLIEESGTLIISESGQQFSIRKPDFKVFSFRSNLVIRYEWIPGSTFFLVWQQNRSQQDAILSQSRAADLVETLRIPGNHIVAAKVSYWLPASRIFK